jgi:hypothetical protein
MFVSPKKTEVSVYSKRCSLTGLFLVRLTSVDKTLITQRFFSNDYFLVMISRHQNKTDLLQLLEKYCQGSFFMLRIGMSQTIRQGGVYLMFSMLRALT